MSEFDLNFGSLVSGQLGDADTDAGENAIEMFHNAMNAMYPGSYTLSLAQLKNSYDPSLLDGMGVAINAVPMNQNDVLSAMNALAASGGGRIPVDFNGFFMALKGQADQVSSWKIAGQAIAATVSDVGTGLQKIGDTVVAAGSTALNITNFALKALPFVLVWWLYKNRDDLGSSAARGVKRIGSAATGGLLGYMGTSAKPNPRKRR